MAAKQIFIICGEASGDLNAANLAKRILEIDPKIKILGVGGGLLRQAGAEIFYDIKGLSVMGLFDVLKKLPKFLRLKKIVLDRIALDKPDAIIFVDFSGFNLRLAKALNKAIPAIYYVSPQVWASRPGRIKTIKKYIDKIIVLFKFEEEFYKKHGVDADFTGHPLLDIVSPTVEKQELLSDLKLDSSKATIALLPGSRKQEILNILPIMLKSCLLIKDAVGAQFVIAKSPQVEWDIYDRLVEKYGLGVKIAEGKTYDVLNIADFALVCSGTATLETAIMGKPFVIIYKMALLNYLLYRPQVKVPYIGMVNIVAQDSLIPEFIQFGAKPDRIAARVISTLKDLSKIEEIKEGLSRVKASLGEKGASSRAAQLILEFLK